MSLTHQFIKPALVLALAMAAQHSYAKKDLFNNSPSGHASVPAQEMVSPPPAEAEEAEPALSSTDAAVRAQQHVDGKVMNVRLFEEESKTLYGVKVLQKNGRMRTVNVDANSGDIIE